LGGLPLLLKLLELMVLLLPLLILLVLEGESRSCVDNILMGETMLPSLFRLVLLLLLLSDVDGDNEEEAYNLEK
jgi:hypothetical protein